MDRVIMAIAGTAAALVLLLSFKTHGTTPAGMPPPAVGSRASGPGSTAPSSTGIAPAKTVTGHPAHTIYGSVQVKITVKNGHITAAGATEYPDSTAHDAQINAYAIPALDKEALAAGSAHIDTISGATYTSEGYITSLQSALNKASL